MKSSWKKTTRSWTKLTDLTENNQKELAIKEGKIQALKVKEKELALATGKLQALEKIFKTQIIEIINKNIIFRKSKDLKAALQQIKELMGWTGLVLPETVAGTSSATPNPEEE